MASHRPPPHLAREASRGGKAAGFLEVCPRAIHPRLCDWRLLPRALPQLCSLGPPTLSQPQLSQGAPEPSPWWPTFSPPSIYWGSSL